VAAGARRAGQVQAGQLAVSPGNHDGLGVGVLALAGQRVTFDVRNRLYSHLLHLPQSFFDRRPVGELVTRITSDVENLAELFSSGVATFLFDLLRIPSVSAKAEHREDCARAARWLHERLERLGFSTVTHATPGHPIVLAEWLRHAGTEQPQGAEG